MSTTYTIFCVILGETTSFSVDIASNKTFDHLKDAIKEKRPIDLGGVDAAKLALYRVDISGSKEARIEELRKMADDFGQRDELDALVKLTKIYSTAPPEETIHIIVQTPQTGEFPRASTRPLFMIDARLLTAASRTKGLEAHDVI
jgi:Crinkler effector protein N-terminal domain